MPCQKIGQISTIAQQTSFFRSIVTTFVMAWATTCAIAVNVTSGGPAFVVSIMVIAFVIPVVATGAVPIPTTVLSKANFLRTVESKQCQNKPN